MEIVLCKLSFQAKQPEKVCLIGAHSSYFIISSKNTEAIIGHTHFPRFLQDQHKSTAPLREVPMLGGG